MMLEFISQKYLTTGTKPAILGFKKISPDILEFKIITKIAFTNIDSKIDNNFMIKK